MQKVQSVVGIMLIGGIFGVQASFNAPEQLQGCLRETQMTMNNSSGLSNVVEPYNYISVDHWQPLVTNLRKKKPQSYYVELYFSDQVDITPLVQAICLKHGHTIENNKLPGLIEVSKSVLKKRPLQESTCVQAQNARYDVKHIYERVISICKLSGASKEILTNLKDEQKIQEDRVCKGMTNATPKAVAESKERAKIRKDKKQASEKNKQQVAVNTQEAVGEGSNNQQLQQLGQAGMGVKKPQLRINTFTNVYDPIETCNNAVGDVHEFKKARYSLVEEQAAEILVSGMRIKNFEKAYFPMQKMSNNAEIK